MISGFTYIHNALEGGYPIIQAIRAVRPYVDEVVVADLESDDGTRAVLNQLDVRIIEGEWGTQAGETLRKAHALHQWCEGEVIVHFEADEVYSDQLIQWVKARACYDGLNDLSVMRLQVEQNFQRVRWYPDEVHRVFPKGSVTKEGHTTDRWAQTQTVGPEHGFLWDCTNCFRDNWLGRVKNQAALWQQEPRYVATPYHFTKSFDVEMIEMFLNQPHWEWKTTPLDIPEILKSLVGMVKYEAQI